MSRIPYWRLSGFYFFYFAFIGAFSPYWSLYLQSLRFDALQIGVLMSLLLVTRIFSPALWGWLADHLGKRVQVVQLAAVAGLLSFCGFFAGESFAWVFMVMLLGSCLLGLALLQGKHQLLHEGQAQMHRQPGKSGRSRHHQAEKNECRQGQVAGHNSQGLGRLETARD